MQDNITKWKRLSQAFMSGLGALAFLTGMAATTEAADSINAPAIIQQPKSLAVLVGEKAEFNVKAGEGWVVPCSDTVNLVMVHCPAGTFTMGSPTGELGRSNNETQHQVTLSKPFWIGLYEVTQEQYKALMGTNPSYFTGGNLPVEQVSWHDATNFCAKLTAKEKAAGRLPTGYVYSLPTEAQWEYACRAGTTTAFNNGTNIPTQEQCSNKPCPNLDEEGWYKYNSGGKTHEVGLKKPNAWELYDMHGNVWEWCLDWYGDYPRGAATDPTGPTAGSGRVIRGGSWRSFANYCRSGYRYNRNPGRRNGNYGFRVALVPGR